MVTSLLGLLKGRQSIFVDYFSQLVVNESSDMEHTSSDDELNDERGWKTRLDFIDTMQRSNDNVDRRLLQVFKFKEENG